ncbi:MAG: hypothetical protein JRN58_07215 [Nitrososphaerota archaeon]|nr:hypothetical protein [Nitrososphaerota archaeon]MDG6967218.1 hypothetical protein [Nitrososphaerota archaeon]MDG6978853.1 hypothetical protein [Nitrososphaerota archaeon]
MKRVYLAAFGSGMGHASRLSALARRLVSAGDRVAFSSSGEVARWLRAQGYACNDLPLVDIRFDESGAFSATETFKFLPFILARFHEQVRREVGNLSRFDPDVVLSDSMASTVVASRLVGVRTVVLLNQLRLSSSPSTPRVVADWLSAASVDFGGAFWDRCEEILVPDLPPPYTISERNLWGAGAISSRARYVGFLVPERARPAEEDAVLRRWRAEQRKPRVFWQISGPPSTRRAFLRKALEVAKALADRYLFVLTAGSPGGETSPTQVPGGYLYGWCRAATSYIATCDAVVSRAGHVSISDYVLNAKPSLLVPIRAQTEQMGNALKVAKLGLGLALGESALEPRTADEALRDLSSGRYSQRAEEVRRVAEGYDAMGSIMAFLSGR